VVNVCVCGERKGERIMRKRLKPRLRLRHRHIDIQRHTDRQIYR